MNLKMSLPKEVAEILDTLKSAGYEAVVVGGCVRDAILGKIPHDYDIATSAVPETVIELFGEEHVVPTGLKHGTVSVVIDHIAYEVTTYRIDGHYSDSRRPDNVTFTSDLREDLSRRDFTMNAIAFDGERFYDYFGGIEDIKNKVIRCVGKAEDRLMEDPLRIMRAVRFAAKLGFEIEEELDKLLLSEMVAYLDKIAIERKIKEFCEAIVADYKVPVLLRYRGIFEMAIHWIENIEDWEKSVSKMNGRNLVEFLYVILEDSVKNPEIMHYQIDLMCKCLRLKNSIKDSLHAIWNLQNVPLTGTEICARRLLRDYKYEDILTALSVKKEKIKANYALQKEKEVLFCLIDRQINTLSHEANNDEAVYSLKKLAISGHDLKALGIEGHNLTVWLNRLLDLVLNGEVENDKDSLRFIVMTSTM